MPNISMYFIWQRNITEWELEKIPESDILKIHTKDVFISLPFVLNNVGATFQDLTCNIEHVEECTPNIYCYLSQRSEKNY